MRTRVVLATGAGKINRSFMHRSFMHMVILVSWCYEPSQPLGILLRLRIITQTDEERERVWRRGSFKKSLATGRLSVIRCLLFKTSLCMVIKISDYIVTALDNIFDVRHAIVPRQLHC